MIHLRKTMVCPFILVFSLMIIQQTAAGTLSHSEAQSRETLYKKAQIALKQKQYQQAITIADELQNRYGETVPFTLIKGIATFHLKDYSQAISTLKRAVNRDATCLQCNKYLGLSYLRESPIQWERGIESLKKAYALAKSKSEKAQIAYLIGIPLIKNKRYSQAIPYLEQASDARIGGFVTDTALCAALSRSKGCEKTLARCAKYEIQGAAPYDLLIVLQSCYLATHQFMKSIELGERALTLNPQRIEAYRLTVRAMLKAPQYDRQEAIKVLHKAIKQGIESGELYTLLARILEEQGERQKALPYYKKALSLTSNDCDLHYRYGHCLELVAEESSQDEKKWLRWALKVYTSLEQFCPGYKKTRRRIDEIKSYLYQK